MKKKEFIEKIKERFEEEVAAVPRNLEMIIEIAKKNKYKDIADIAEDTIKEETRRIISNMYGYYTGIIDTYAMIKNTSRISISNEIYEIYEENKKKVYKLEKEYKNKAKEL